MSADCWLPANWQAPAGVHAGCTLRTGGVSRGPYSSLNLAAHVGDDEANLRCNRGLIARQLGLPAEPLWLTQTHSNRVIPAASDREADAAYTDRPGHICAILTADCVPVLLCHSDGTGVAAVHVGWRGLCNGILENTIRALGRTTRGWRAWIGPHICTRCYEVGGEVREAALVRYPHAGMAFAANAGGRWQFSLSRLISRVLNDSGIDSVSHAGGCTFEQAERFFSYRREGRTGRMASLIWIDRLST